MALRTSFLFLLATLILAVTAIAPSAAAQQSSIDTSANANGGRFFGEGAVRVIIEDEDADDSASDEIEVEIDIGAVGSTFTIPDTSDGSQRFEFFLMHVDSFLNDTAGGYPDLDGIAGTPTVVTFGVGGDLDTGDGLFLDARIDIDYEDQAVELDYKETTGAIDLDRDSFGTDSFVFVSILDQDANVNPTERDEFTVNPVVNPNDDLLVLNGGMFVGAIVFRETGDNTAIFEGEYRLGQSIIVGSEALGLRLFDKANYNATLAAPENDSNITDEISFTVGNSDGSIGSGGQQTEPTWDPTLDVDRDLYSIGESVHVIIDDRDANVDSGTSDSIRLSISSGGSEIEVLGIETGANTGVFQASFVLAAETDAETGTIKPDGSSTITYTDSRPADYYEKLQLGQNPEKDFALEIDIQLPVKTGVKATDVTAPVARNAAGGRGAHMVGDLVTLSTSISNNNDEQQPFVALIEVRDSDGVTVFLALQSGTLEPSGSKELGVIWQPTDTGTYEIRTFTVSDIRGGEVLSPLAASRVTVT